MRRCVQQHGFLFENEVRRVFGLSFERINTCKFDIPKSLNRLNPRENISVKVSGSGVLYCSDILRFFNMDFKDTNTIICGRYTQHNDYKKVHTVAEIYHTRALHDRLFGTCSWDELDDYAKYIKTVSPQDSPEYLAKKNEIQNKHNMQLVINPKVDSKDQRRVQCSFPFKILRQEDMTTTTTIRGRDFQTVFWSPARA